MVDIFNYPENVQLLSVSVFWFQRKKLIFLPSYLSLQGDLWYGGILLLQIVVNGMVYLLVNYGEKTLLSFYNPYL